MINLYRSTSFAKNTRDASSLVRLITMLVTSLLVFYTWQPGIATAQAGEPVPFYPLPDSEDATLALRTASVVGGEEAAPDAWTWTVALVRTDRDPYYGQFCGGTLIEARWVLTAAHCVVHDSTVLAPDALYVWANSHALTGTEGDRVPVEQVIPHADFSRDTAENDIALLKLATPVEGATVGLPTTEALRALAQPSTMATVIGWGTTASESRVDKRHQVDVPIVDAPTCAAAYSTWTFQVTDTMLCAGYADGGYDACSGDSGGPLVVPNPNVTANSDEPAWIKVGIVSWGRGCARADSYGVYTHVAEYSTWIEAQLNAEQSAGGGTALLPADPGDTGAPGPQGAESNHPIFLPVIQR